MINERLDHLISHVIKLYRVGEGSSELSVAGADAYQPAGLGCAGAALCLCTVPDQARQPRVRVFPRSVGLRSRVRVEWGREKGWFCREEPRCVHWTT
jgi:hypothetical protein